MIGWIVAAVAIGLASCLWAELRRVRARMDSENQALAEYLAYYVQELQGERKERLRWEKAYGEQLGRDVT